VAAYGLRYSSGLEYLEYNESNKDNVQ